MDQVSHNTRAIRRSGPFTGSPVHLQRGADRLVHLYALTKANDPLPAGSTGPRYVDRLGPVDGAWLDEGTQLAGAACSGLFLVALLALYHVRSAWAHCRWRDTPELMMLAVAGSDESVPPGLHGVQVDPAYIQPAVLRDILHHYGNQLNTDRPNIVLDGEALAIVMETIKLHPRSATKIGVGIQNVFVGWSTHGSPCFNIQRVDGSVEDFSYRKCFELPAYREESFNNIMQSNSVDPIGSRPQPQSTPRQQVPDRVRQQQAPENEVEGVSDRDDVDELQEYMEQQHEYHQQQQESKRSTAPLTGYTLCLAGVFSITHGQMKELIESLGGQVSTSVTAKVTHLVCKGSKGFNSAKHAAALQRGIPIVDEDLVMDAARAASL
mmetsp:Transcript_6615/g.11892  ORF Transcript_6615/g.11892 Transcript_6615/m.11892 type:complete len:380 (-) Transcript_6615:1631-2770(-)